MTSRYDPEADDTADDEKVVHPKTSDQRERLSEACEGILIFKSLDPSQLTDVVEAMFERRVTPNETVIRQGDDGDNFYVVDRGMFVGKLSHIFGGVSLWFPCGYKIRL